MIIASFVYYEWPTLSLIAIAENGAVACEQNFRLKLVPFPKTFFFKVSFARCLGYAILVKIFFYQYKGLIDKLLDDRQVVISLLTIIILLRLGTLFTWKHKNRR